MNDKAVKKEYNRLIALLEGAEVPQKQRDSLAAVVDNLAWQRVKLDETRQLMKDEQIITTYNNGGNQTGTRENPIFKGYSTLWRDYLKGLDKFTSYLPKEMQEEVKGETISIMDKVIKMKRGTV